MAMAWVSNAYLHWSLLGEHVLFERLRLETLRDFVLASLLIVVICMTERLTTFATSRRWSPFSSSPRARWCHALWRASLFGIATGLRLLYMLIAMTYHIGLILLMVATLTLGQFVIELLETPPSRRTDGYQYLEDPLLVSEDVPTAVPLTTRPRSRPKPNEIFIHPTQSNLVRADARAAELGLGGDTDLVHNHRYPTQESMWEQGKGQELARALMDRQVSEQ